MSHRRDVATDVREVFSKSREDSRGRVIQIKTLYYTSDLFLSQVESFVKCFSRHSTV